MATILGIDTLYFILILEILGGIGFILGWFLYNKNKFTVYLCEKYLKTFKVIKKMKVDLSRQNFKWKDFVYNIDYVMAIIDNKGKPVLYYLVKGAQPINIFDNKNLDIKIDSQTFKVFVDGKTMQHLGSRRADKMLTYIILGLVIVIGVVSIFAIYNSNLLNKDLVTLAKQIANMTKVTKPLPVG